MDTRVDELERLAALHRQGVLTDEELASQKARVLGAGPTPRAPILSSAAVGSDVSQLSPTWQRRVAFFSQHGSPYRREGMAALRSLPFWTQVSIRFNIWAYLFGPLYFVAVGIWRRGLSLLAVGVVIELVVDRLLGSEWSRAAGFGVAGLFASTVNYYRFIKLTQGRDEWNPLTDLTSSSTPSTARAD